jgi:hypothetical protein
MSNMVTAAHNSGCSAAHQIRSATYPPFWSEEGCKVAESRPLRFVPALEYDLFVS